jgi:hypothetical protein
LQEIFLIQSRSIHDFIKKKLNFMHSVSCVPQHAQISLINSSFPLS